jgi:cell wall-associated NlpC family hydrolase
MDTTKLNQTKSKLNNKSTQPITANYKGNSRTNSKIDSLVIIAHQYMGNKYRRGGASTAGFDCSGYTMTVFKQLNIKLPHTSAGQGLIGVTINQKNIQKGDLMVSAGFGYAKANNDAQLGQVIGKALADFSGAKGQIEIVVGRL